MHRQNNAGLRLDLTQNTPDSSLLSGSSASNNRLPSLVVEHAEAPLYNGQQQHQQQQGAINNEGHSSGNYQYHRPALIGENLNSKLPNVVEGSMDYGSSERRSSRYLVDYDAAAGLSSAKTIYHQEIVPSSSLNYGVAESGYLDRGYHPVSRMGTYDRKNTVGFDDGGRYGGDPGATARMYGHRDDAVGSNGPRFERERGYAESDLDAPYDPVRSYGGATDPSQDPTRRYSRELNDYEFARYAEETLKLEPKKASARVTYSDVSSTHNGYDSGGIKTNHDHQAYDLAAAQQQAEMLHRAAAAAYDSGGKYHGGGGAKMYGTLPRRIVAGPRR
ncbi:uncharacterized protein LOC111694289 [Trichogramma pretiosum]|uniref:uncharacterized protein LOC111694289 n=1 Tax=Trichogramma pretiosum TaxID=7493 RepID=UPI000C719B80|nr:uncharacterized protein LOC111694289 [Trichogramma pretiosum]